MEPLRQLKSFEDDMFLRVAIHNLIVHHDVKSVIETGTEYGGTANAFAQMVQSVVTIDVTQQCDLSQLYPNVTFIESDSRTSLPYAISLIPPELQPTLFYLDAHTQDFSKSCPLRDELKIIQESKLKNPLIVIHDCMVPDHPEFGYATYQGAAIRLEYVEDLLSNIYPKGFKTNFNTQASGAQRGVLFIVTDATQPS